MGKIATVTDCTDAVTLCDMFTLSDTGWEPETVKASIDGADSGGFRAIVRSDTKLPLAFVSDRFRANNHVDQLARIEPLVGNGMLKPFGVSSWDNGAILAYQFAVPSLGFQVGGCDSVRTLLTLMFSYGPKIADMAFFGNFRAFCKNQMGAFSSLAGNDKVRHRGQIDARFADILSTKIDELSGKAAERLLSMQAMTERQMSHSENVSYFLNAAGLKDDEREAVYTALAVPGGLTNPNVTRLNQMQAARLQDDCGAPNTLWNAYNAVTRYTSHMAGRTDATRMRSVLTGPGATINARAWDVAGNLLTVTQ